MDGNFICAYLNFKTPTHEYNMITSVLGWEHACPVAHVVRYKGLNVSSVTACWWLCVALKDSRIHIATNHFYALSPGGADKNVVVFDRREEQIVATLKGHTKKVSSVIYHPAQVGHRSCSLYTCTHSRFVSRSHISLHMFCQSVVFSASPDSTIRVWSVTGGNCVQVIRAHEAGVTGLSLHATGDYLLSSSEDQVRPKHTGWWLRNSSQATHALNREPLQVVWQFSFTSLVKRTKALFLCLSECNASQMRVCCSIGPSLISRLDVSWLKSLMRPLDVVCILSVS